MTPSVLAEITAEDVASFDAISTGVLLLRVCVGLVMAAHGYNKWFGGGRIAGTAGWFESMGMRPNGKVHAVTAATTELVGGLMLAVGLLTPLAAASVVGIMVVAGWTSYWEKRAFFIFKGGYEFNLTLAVAAVAVATIGPGRYSLDWLLEITPAFDPNVGLALSAGLGLVAGIGLLLACYRPPAPETEAPEAEVQEADTSAAPEAEDS